MTIIHSFISQRQSSTLPSHPEPNPKKEEVSVMSTRSGRPMTELKKKEKVTPP